MSLFFITQVLHAEDQLHCRDEINNNIEIYKLLSVVKNEVLGSTPMFCREDAHAQLMDDEDAGDKSLNEFVHELYAFKPNVDDTLKIKLEDKSVLDRTVFNTVKMIVLKKMWQQSSSDNQYALLISPECAAVGLNRLPIEKRTKEAEAVIEKNKKDALAKAKIACKSTTFSDIAPFLSKDVLAEALLNLKNVFPQSFPVLVKAVCSNIRETDEYIFKADNYEDFARGQLSINSARDFTSWLKSIYADARNAEALRLKKIKDEEAKLLDDSIDPNGYEVQYQKSMKDLFLKTNPKAGATEVKHPYKLGYMIKKNSYGYYIEVPDKNKKKELENIRQEKEAFQKQQSDQFVQKTLATTPKRLEELYKKSKGPGEKVLDPEVPGFFVEKNEKGEFYYKASPQLLKAIKSSLDQEEKELLSKENQATLRREYKEQLRFTDDEDGKSYTILEKTRVYLDKDGIYRKEKGDIEKYISKNIKLLAEKITKKGSGDPVPGIYKGTGYVLGKDGEYKYTSIPTFFNYNAPVDTTPPVVNVIKEKDITEKINEYIIKKYQNETSDFSKLNTLTDDEAKELKGYTLGGFRDLNTCLRKNNCSPDQEYQVSLILSGLNKIKREKGEGESSQIIFRGTQGLPESIRAALKKENEAFTLDKGFMSSTGDHKVAFDFAGPLGGVIQPNQYVFIMKTKSCVGISPLSAIEKEDEFLCPPGLKFKSTPMKNANGYYIIEEVD